MVLHKKILCLLQQAQSSIFKIFSRLVGFHFLVPEMERREGQWREFIPCNDSRQAWTIVQTHSLYVTGLVDEV